MGDMREALRDGDQTTTGGVLEASGPGLDHGGRKVAGEGDWASCPACKMGGKVTNDAFPSTTLPDGRQVLVRGAKVMCSCSDKPLVTPSQHTFKIEVNRSGIGQPVPTPGSSTKLFDEAFILKDKRSGYMLESSGRILRWKLDNSNVSQVPGRPSGGFKLSDPPEFRGRIEAKACRQRAP